MVETLQNNGLWHVTLAEDDLVKKAGLDRKDFEQDFGFFKYKGRIVVISHIHNEHLVVSMEGSEDADLNKLMDAFSTVVEYEPFCKYRLLPEGKAPILPTYEWDKVNPEERYKELSAKTSVSDLVRLQQK
jgi:hypothetical protein